MHFASSVCPMVIKQFFGAFMGSYSLIPMFNVSCEAIQLFQIFYIAGDAIFFKDPDVNILDL